MSESDLLRRITSDPAIFGGTPIVRGRRLAVEHVLSMFAAGDAAASEKKRSLRFTEIAEGDSGDSVPRTP